MVFDTLDNAHFYASMHPRFPAAFEFFRSGRATTLPDGEFELDGRQLYVMIASFPGRGRKGAKLESHRRYIDIQYVLKGSDEIGLLPTSQCRDVEMPYVEDRDLILYRDHPTNWLIVPEGSFAIFYPDDAHAPLAGTAPVSKAVLKVAVMN